MVIGHYTTAKEAKEALQNYINSPTQKFNITVAQLFYEWKEIAYRNISKATVDNNNASYSKLKPIYNEEFRELRTGQMQAIIDVNSNLSHSSLVKLRSLLN